MSKKLFILFPTIALSGFILGFAGGRASKKEKTPTLSGRLRIDNSDPDLKNAIFLELYVPVEKLSSERYAHLEVLNENYLRK